MDRLKIFFQSKMGFFRRVKGRPFGAPPARGMTTGRYCVPQGLVNVDFAVLIALLIGVNVPLFSAKIIPATDTLGVFEVFYYFYNHLFFHHEFPRWVPFLSNGIPAYYYQVTALTGFDYWTMLAGLLFKVRNVLGLFKVSLFLQQTVFLAGTYLLGRSIYRRRLTVFLVTAAACGSLFWIYEIFFNFRIFYLFPWALLPVFRFFSQKRPVYFWSAGVCFLLALVGNLLYYAGLWLWALTGMAVVLWTKDKKIFKCLFERSFSNAVSCVMFAGTAAAYGLYLRAALKGLTFIAMERDPSGGVPLKTFLTYGFHPKAPALMSGLLFGIPFSFPTDGPFWLQNANTVYAGAVTAFFIIWSWLFVRHRYQIALMCGALGLGLLGLSTPAASVIYHFPLLKYFRYIGHIFSLMKLLLLVCAGFGIDHMLALPGRERARKAVIASAVFVGTAGWLLSTEPLAPRGALLSWSFANPLLRMGAAALIGAGFWFISKRKLGGRGAVETSVTVFLLGALAFDLVAFQRTAVAKSPKVPGEQRTLLTSVDVSRTPPAMSIISGKQYWNARQKAAYQLFYNAPTGWNSFFLDAFLGGESCDPDYRRDVAVSEIPGTESFFSSLNGGCGIPKMRFAQDVRVFPNAAEAETAFHQMREEAWRALKDSPPEVIPARFNDFENILSDVLFVVRKDRPEENRHTTAGNRFDLVEASSNKLILKMRVADPGGAWFFWADAFHSGWSVEIDGKPDVVRRANVGFKAVSVPSGDHEVRFVFDGGLRLLQTSVFLLFILVWSGWVLFRTAKLLVQPPVSGEV
jgi:hypothetical protein